MTISNPNSIFYASISKGTTILAEFNSQNADLGALAAKCLGNAPTLHTAFSHTVRKRTYTFLIADPFLYFAISDETLENSEVFAFLRSVKEGFDGIFLGEDIRSTKSLNSHCFQGEFNPVFHQLLASQVGFEGPNSPTEFSKHDRSGSLDSHRGKRIGSVPLLCGVDISLSFKKKNKKRFSVETNEQGKDVVVESKVDVSDHTIVLSRDFSMSMAKNGLFSDLPRHKAKQVWKKHVWVVLSLDLIVCSILFGVWLWVCSGFKCIDG